MRSERWETTGRAERSVGVCIGSALNSARSETQLLLGPRKGSGRCIALEPRCVLGVALSPHLHPEPDFVFCPELVDRPEDLFFGQSFTPKFVILGLPAGAIGLRSTFD